MKKKRTQIDNAMMFIDDYVDKLNYFIERAMTDVERAHYVGMKEGAENMRLYIKKQMK